MVQSKDTKVYEELADALNALPNGFPRTPSNVEIPLLQPKSDSEIIPPPMDFADWEQQRM